MIVKVSKNCEDRGGDGWELFGYLIRICRSFLADQLFDSSYYISFLYITCQHVKLCQDRQEGKLTTGESIRADEQIVAIGRNYADHAKELGNAIPKGQSLCVRTSSGIDIA